MEKLILPEWKSAFSISALNLVKKHNKKLLVKTVMLKTQNQSTQKKLIFYLLHLTKYMKNLYNEKVYFEWKTGAVILSISAVRYRYIHS